LGPYYLTCDGAPPLLFTENETNNARLFPQHANVTPYVKDGINDFVVNAAQSTINPALTGTKVAAHYRFTIPSGSSQSVRLRLKDESAAPESFGPDFDAVVARRRGEADEFYANLTPRGTSPETASVLRRGPVAR
jgi:hypothetical protein